MNKLLIVIAGLLSFCALSSSAHAYIYVSPGYSYYDDDDYGYTSSYPVYYNTGYYNSGYYGYGYPGYYSYPGIGIGLGYGHHHHH